MEISVAVRMIEKGIEHTTSPQWWADLGAGNGLFTKALAKILTAGSTIYAIDKDISALRQMKLPSEDILLKTLKKDFINDTIELEPLDGVVMANSLHFVKDALFFLGILKEKLKTSGRILLIEYDSTVSNQWVPYPVSYKALQALARGAGFKSVNKLDEEPSLYQKANIYAALVQ